MAQKMLLMAVLVILGTTMATVTVANPTCLPCAPYFNNTDVQLPDDCCKPLQRAV
ncbi:hypothetical protein Goari_020213, partial [Gossypium aridum]|nr:hypothetical protein [Gossypium aridum]